MLSGTVNRGTCPGRLRKHLEALADARRVVLVGVGNVGSRLAMELPLVGVREVLLVDHDRVSRRNLSTCWAFGPDDVGCLKAETLARRLRFLFPQVTVDAAPCPFSRLGLVRLRERWPAILLGAVDSRRGRYELAEAALWLEMPLVDLAIPASGPPAARVRVTWWSARKIDPLNAWSERDWALMEESQPCGAVSRTGRDDAEQPVASSVSGAAASSLGAAEVRRLLQSDVSNVGWEIRADLACSSTARRALPSSGLSPLDCRDVIRAPPARSQVATVSELVDEAERLKGRGALLLLNREVSEGFLCRRCGAESPAGPVGWRYCEQCGDPLVPVKPMTRLSRDTIGDLGKACVVCLGVERDLLRVTDRTERARRWLEYCRRGP